MLSNAGQNLLLTERLGTVEYMHARQSKLYICADAQNLNTCHKFSTTPFHSNQLTLAKRLPPISLH